MSAYHSRLLLDGVNQKPCLVTLRHAGPSAGGAAPDVTSALVADAIMLATMSEEQRSTDRHRPAKGTNQAGGQVDNQTIPGLIWAAFRSIETLGGGLVRRKSAWCYSSLPTMALDRIRSGGRVRPEGGGGTW